MRIFLFVYLLSMATLIAGGIAGGVVLYRSMEPDDPAEAAASEHGYDLVAWEIRHFPEKWLQKLQDGFGGQSEDEANQTLCAYFRAGPDERSEEIENDVEDVIEGRITEVLEDENLALEPPLFEDLGLVFPPVDFEIDATPRVLAVSPRERIELRDSYLLEAEIPPDEIETIEREAQSENGDNNGVSALVIRTGGFSSYPSVVFEDASYESLVETAFHEWLHSYLLFYPLGTAYFGSSEARTLNESVSNIAGAELAALYLEKYGSLDEACGAEPPAATPTPASQAEDFDFTAEMRALRQEVETMLVDGRIEEAEALMAAKRDEFEEKGVFIRKLNQAYFAFHGFYADTPASIDPIGLKLQALLDSSGSPGEFVRAASGITSRSELDEALN
jgi:hypothetical protein